MSTSYLARASRYLEQTFNAKGGPPIIDVAPALHVEIPFLAGAESLKLQGWDLFGLTIDRGPVAANLIQFRMRNPVGSNVIAVVTKLVEAAVATDTYQVSNGPATTDFNQAEGGSTLRLDARTIRSATLILSTATNTPAPGSLANTLMRILLAINTNWDFLQGIEIPLLPGDALQVGSAATVNQRQVTHVIWRERAMESSELT